MKRNRKSVHFSISFSEQVFLLLPPLSLSSTAAAKDAQNSSQIVTINKPTPSFLQVRCSSCQPINSDKALC